MSRMRVNDRLSIRVGETRYSYTIDADEAGFLGIIALCNIYREGIREVLDDVESKGGYISPYTGKLFFRERDVAGAYMGYIEEKMQRKVV